MKKTNLLEAVAMLATSNSFHASSDREIVNWHASEHVTRIVAAVERQNEEVNIEIVIFDPTQQEKGASAEKEFQFIPPNDRQRKRIKINSVPKRAIDLIGLVTVVLFSPNDLGLVDGSPEERRRFLDRGLCQMQPHYCQVAVGLELHAGGAHDGMRQLRPRQQPRPHPEPDTTSRRDTKVMK